MSIKLKIAPVSYHFQMQHKEIQRNQKEEQNMIKKQSSTDAICTQAPIKSNDLPCDKVVIVNE